MGVLKGRRAGRSWPRGRQAGGDAIPGSGARRAGSASAGQILGQISAERRGPGGQGLGLREEAKDGGREGRHRFPPHPQSVGIRREGKGGGRPGEPLEKSSRE